MGFLGLRRAALRRAGADTVLEKIYRELIERRAAMALECFDSPPSDWAGFRQRIGAYQELDALIGIVKYAMSGLEIDEA